MIGVPPVALDFLTTIAELDFEACWQRRVADDIESIPVAYLGRDDLIESKQIVDRPQDRADIRKLNGPSEKGDECP